MAETKKSDTERETTRNDNVYMKLYYIQSKLKVGKNRDFDCHGRKYAYRNADDILTAVKPLLAETKTVLLTPAEAVFKEGGFARKDATNAGRWYMKATAVLVDINTKETVECSREAREPENKPGMDDTQVSGSAISYALKYALAGLFALDDGQNDPDEGTPEEKKEMQNRHQGAQQTYPQGEKGEPYKAPRINQGQFKQLEQRAKDAGVSVSQILARNKAARGGDLTELQWSQAMKQLDKLVDQRARA